MGKATPHGTRSAGRTFVILAALGGPVLLAGCAAGTDPTGVWIGRLHTVAGTCPSGFDSDLVVSARQASFVPGQGVLTLVGRRATAAPDTIRAQHAGVPIDGKPYPMVFEGRFAPSADGGVITGTYGTPECRAIITLHRAST